MTTFAVIATGESMSQEVADSIRHLRRIVISDAFRLAPDADALCANDVSWWRANKDTESFKGRKFSVASVPKVEQVPRGIIETGSNSALLGLHVAVTVYKAIRVLLYGVDMKGTHYFGPHKTLKNSTPERFEIMKTQFARYPLKGVEVFNCSPISELKCYPFA